MRGGRQAGRRREVYDTDRIMSLLNNLAQRHRATADGVPVKSYFL